MRLQANEALEKVKLQINKGIININNISDKVIKEGFKTKGSLLDTWRHGTWIRDAANTFLVGQVEARDSGFLNEIQGQLRNPSLITLSLILLIFIIPLLICSFTFSNASFACNLKLLAKFL